MNLTERQKLFADEYLISLNATEAAIKAGYSENTAYAIGYENLNKPHIKNYIDERMRKKESKLIASQDEVLEYLTSVLRGEMEEECLTVESMGDGTSRARIATKKVTPKDRTKAAELLAKRYGMLTDNHNLSGSIGVQIVDDLEDD